jgi:gas vesicle protein
MSQLTQDRTRRSLLGAGVGALAASVAGMLGASRVARAANDEPLTAGNTFTASATTEAGLQRVMLCPLKDEVEQLECVASEVLPQLGLRS